MPKIILDKEDLLDLIKKSYSGAEIINPEILSKVEVVIRVKSIPQQLVSAPEPERVIVRDDSGNIDADKSGLTLKNRSATTPGGAMGRDRGHLPVF